MAEVKNRINFFVPIEISKGKDDKGEEVMKIGGIASTSDKDADDEFLDPKGFDLSSFLKSGYLNWNHATKEGPQFIVGEPTRAEVRSEGLYIEGVLYNDSPLAKSIYDTAKVLKSSPSGRALGFSIEGKVIERDLLDPKKIKKAKITGCAITHCPKNPNTLLNIIKGDTEFIEPEFEEVEEKNITKDLHNAKNFSNFKNNLTKSEVYEEIYSQAPDLKVNEVKNVYKFIEVYLNSQKMDLSTENIRKALGKLDLLGSQESSMEKSEDVVVTPEAKEKESESKNEDVVKSETEIEIEKAEKTLTELRAKKEAEAAAKEVKEDTVVKAESNDLSKSFGEIQDLIKAQSDNINKQFATVSDISKGLLEKTESLISQNEELKKSNQDLAQANDNLKKSLDEIASRVSNLESETPGRKSVQTRNFIKKGEDENNIGGGEGLTRLSVSNKIEKAQIVKALQGGISYQDGGNKEAMNLLGEIAKFEAHSANITPRLEHEARKKGILITQ